jgi:predicted nucleic acid-binding protein
VARAELILDSSIVIDWLLHVPVAIAWSKTIDYRRIGITSITIMEVLSGARNKREMDTIGHSLARFEHFHILREDSVWAVRQFRAYWLSHQIGMNACLIGAIAVRTQLPVYTLNSKDFEPLPDISVVKPY